MMERNGRIITFYSYKGGTGRTMALANTAWVLASNGHRVLMIDWDLEAPGLHRYFHPFLTDPHLANTKGMIDFVFDYQRKILALPEVEITRKLPAPWYDENVDVLPYISELTWSEPKFGEVHLLPAGRQWSEYGTRVNTFNWRQLYDNLGGFEFFEFMKRQVTAEYDYILIDSRTGVSDTSGISTVQMPSALVVCFTLNSQSIEGAGEVALSVVEQRRKEYEEGKLRVFPVPTRLEKAEKQKLDVARDAARTKFDTFLTRLAPTDRDRYWGEVEIYYEPFYAYEEVLAAFADKPGSISSLLASVERLTGRVTDGEVNEIKHVSPARRQEILSVYERRPTLPASAVTQAAAFLKRLGPEQEEMARAILLRLVTIGAGEKAFRTSVATDDFTEQERPILDRLVDEGVLLRKLSEDTKTEYVVIADENLPQTWPTLRGWIQEQQNAVRLRAMLDQRAEHWDHAGRPSGLLLSSRETSEVSKANIPYKQFSLRVLAFFSASQKRARTWRWISLCARYGAALILFVYLGYVYAGPRLQTYWILHRVQKQTNPIDGQTYVLIPKGEVKTDCAGASNYYCNDHDIKIENDFWLGQTEVTNAAYTRYLQANYPDEIKSFKGNFQGPQYPVTNVDWLDAVNYCSWAGGRLPTPNEWEYAARGGNRGRFITGDTLDKSKISVDTLRPVARFVPNRFGLFDMTGNAAEWTGDLLPALQQSALYNQKAQAAIRNRNTNVASQQPYITNPWPSTGGVREVQVRGGAYDGVTNDFDLNRASYRMFNQADITIGFRCVLPVSDLQEVASNYRAFSTFYGLYGYFYHPSFNDPYHDWWYTLYLRQMKNANRR